MTVGAADANRLTYLDENDPFYVSRSFPRLVTPQWVGEDGVEAVVILAIDDMRETAKYEKFLRPILQRLKKIDGRAPVSIMTCKIDPDDPQLQTWLKEGLSLETHTIDHPCPLPSPLTTAAWICCTRSRVVGPWHFAFPAATHSIRLARAFLTRSLTRRRPMATS